MPDNNRFAGLGEAVEEPAEPEAESDWDETETESGEDDEAADTGTEAASAAEGGADSAAAGGAVDATEGEAGTSSDSTIEAAPDETGPVPATEAGPAFEFDDTTAKSIYVREETLQILEDTEFEVEMLLRREHDVRDVTGREFHDAAVRVLESHPEEIVSAILDAREHGDD